MTRPSETFHRQRMFSRLFCIERGSNDPTPPAVRVARWSPPPHLRRPAKPKPGLCRGRRSGPDAVFCDESFPPTWPRKEGDKRRRCNLFSDRSTNLVWRNPIVISNGKWRSGVCGQKAGGECHSDSLALLSPGRRYRPPSFFLLNAHRLSRPFFCRLF